MGRRVWWAVIGLVVVVLLVFAVNKAKRGGEQATSPGSQAKKIVVVINNGPKETDKVGLANLKKDIAAFNKVYPNIVIKWTDRGYSPDSFTTSMAGGTAEDVIALWATEGYVAERGYALDLTDLINRWEYRDQLNMDMLKPFEYQGRYFALPGSGYIIGLWYNKKLFKEAGLVASDGQFIVPQNWDEFREIARKLTNRQKGIAGFGIYGKDAFAGWGLLNWVWQAGGDFEKQIQGKWRAVFGEPEAVKALQFIKELRWQDNIFQNNLLAAPQDIWQLFAAGQIAMTNGTNDWTPTLVNQFGMKLSDIGMALLPAGPAGRANQLGGDYYIINPKRPKEVQEAAFKWITWRILRSMDPQIIRERGEQLRKEKRIERISSVPVFRGEIDQKMRAAAAEYRDVYADWPEVWREASKYIRPEPPFFSQQLYSEYLGPAVQAVLTQKSADPARLLKKAAAEFEARFLSQVRQK